MVLQQRRLDDLNGDEDAITCVITVNGRGVEIDLGERSQAQLVELLAPYFGAAGVEQRNYDVQRRGVGRPKGAPNKVKAAPVSAEVEVSGEPFVRSRRQRTTRQGVTREDIINFVLAHPEGVTSRQIAEALGTDVKTVSNRTTAYLQTVATSGRVPAIRNDDAGSGRPATWYPTSSARSAAG